MKAMRMPQRRWLAALVFGAGFAPSRLTTAEEFVLYDGSCTHTAQTMGFSYPKIRSQPDDWTFPVDYAEGTSYTRIIVKSTASDTTISYQWCLFQGGTNHTCRQLIKFDRSGTYNSEQPLKDMWSNFKVDWMKKFDRFMLVVKDAGGAPVDSRFGFGGKWIGSPNFDLYYPFEVHVTVIIVSAGEKFSGWDNYVPGMPGISGRIVSMTTSERIKAYASAGRLGRVWTEAEKRQRSNDPEEAREGRRIVEFLEEYVDRRRAEALRLKAKEPVRAVESLSELAKKISPHGKSREILNEAKEWNREPSTKRARAAEAVFLQMKRASDLLKKKLGGKKATDPGSARRLARDIAAVTAYARTLKERFPETNAARRALAICGRLGIEVP